MCGPRFELWTQTHVIESRGYGRGHDHDYKQALMELGGLARERAQETMIYQLDCSGFGESFEPYRLCQGCREQGVVDGSGLCWLCEYRHNPLPAISYKADDFQ